MNDQEVGAGSCQTYYCPIPIGVDVITGSRYGYDSNFDPRINLAHCRSGSFCVGCVLLCSVLAEGHHAMISMHALVSQFKPLDAIGSSVSPFLPFHGPGMSRDRQGSSNTQLTQPHFRASGLPKAHSH